MVYLKRVRKKFGSGIVIVQKLLWFILIKRVKILWRCLGYRTKIVMVYLWSKM